METDGKERQEEEGKDEPGLTPQVRKLCYWLTPQVRKLCWLTPRVMVLNFLQTVEVKSLHFAMLGLDISTSYK